MRVLMLCLTLCCSVTALASTGFTYQGNLQQQEQPYSGDVDMEFTLFADETYGTQISDTINRTVAVTDGLFQVELDFGNAVFEAAPDPGWWLQIDVAGVELSPRQSLAAAPIALRGAYAHFASGSGKATGATSTALGSGTLAEGDSSTAMGSGAYAGGDHSTAMGWSTRADGIISTAMGSLTRADGPRSTAMGFYSRAHGDNSTSMGRGTRAYANDMVAMGSYNAPTGVSGSSAPDRPALVVGNGSSDSDRSYAMYLQFNGNLRIAGSLFETSSREVKHDIEPVEPLEILNKVSRLDISTWRYNHSPDTLHVGPMAQDFHAAFGVGEDDTSISTIDTSGVSLAAIQGVHEMVQEERDRVAALEELIQSQNAHLGALKRELTGLRETIEMRPSEPGEDR